MPEEKDYSDLRAFALLRIAAEKYPHASHIFRRLKCRKCGEPSFEVVVSHYSGSRQGDFRGTLLGRCSSCGDMSRLFSRIRKDTEAEKSVQVRCDCGGNNTFLVGECDRVEREPGLPGFWDEGVVVGKCTHCNANQVIFATD